MSEELKPCPFCGEKIEPLKSRRASTDRSEGFVAFAACYCGGYSATAHKMGRGNTEAEAIQEVITLWNRRAQPAEVEGVEVVAWLHRQGNHTEAADRPLTDEEEARRWEQDELMTVTNHLAALSAVTAERDRLLEEMAELWKRIDKFQSQSHGITALAEIERLRAEVEALRKDAERYRWLRRAGYADIRDIPSMAPTRMDEFIDAALQES